ncbi:hypothetical protein ABEX47_03610, partial [Paenibacillus ehimensis]|uniref:hypothetical protein n=1 Tax=Paenibacillus ehimensis TaxID=79264 RepID=UPI003D29190F
SVFKGQFGFSMPPNRLFQTAGRLTYHIACPIATVNFRPFGRFNYRGFQDNDHYSITFAVYLASTLFFHSRGRTRKRRSY